MKKELLSFLFLLIFSVSFSQEEGMDMPMDNQPRASRNPRLYGKVVDNNNKGLDAASVEIFMIRKNPVEAGVYDSLIGGMLTKPNGDFSFPNLRVPDSFAVKISSLNFTPVYKIVYLDKRDLRGNVADKDLGNIRLNPAAESLTEIKIVATKPALQMGIDRKIFNVDKSLTSAGGTAIDVMRNIPSVTVDVNGDVQLRNASPQIFVDGRPTILTLQQIPADDIERVELITNPSAKFDAATTAGIINVVLKKSRRSGLNGIASIGGGYPNVLNGNLSLNLRQGKFNFFASGNYNQSGGIARSEAKRQNKENGLVTDYFNQVSKSENTRRFTSARFGMDYFIDNRNTISISQNFVQGRFSTDENQEQEYLDASATLTQLGERKSFSRNQFNRSSTQLNFKHDFPKSGHELTADVTFNKGRNNNNSNIANYYFNPDGSSVRDPNFVRNNGFGNNTQITVQTDYVNPINDSSRIELGLRAFFNDNSNVLNSFSQINGGEIKLPLSTNVKYDERVLAAYATYSNKWKNFRYQLGLRAEYSKFNGVLVDSAQKFGYTLPEDFRSIFDGLFPSVFLTREFNNGNEFQLNFSRRIRRPNFWQLNPYIDINDPLNISQGNPALRPEYVNAFEFNYGKRYNKGNFLAVLYFHNNTRDITRYSDTITAAQYQQLNNAAIEPNAILNTFVNAQYTNRMGAEFTLNHRLGNLEIIPNINLQYRRVKAQINDLNLSNEGFNWEGKLILNYKLASKSPVFNNMSFQLNGQFESQEVIPQGRNKEQYELDFAIRKEFLKNNAGALTFAVNDVFNSRRWGQIYDTETFYQDSYRRRNVRNIRLTFTYRFGKRDFQMFNGREGRRGGGERNRDIDD